MATFEIKTKERMNVNGEFVDKGLSVQISTMNSNPFDDIEKNTQSLYESSRFRFKIYRLFEYGIFNVFKYLISFL